MATSFWRHYGFSLSLALALLVGSLLGCVLKTDAAVLKPFGDIFLNLLFTVVVPLVFFSIAAAVSGMTNPRRLGRILFWMMAVFIVTGVIASAVMLVSVTIFPPAADITLTAAAESAADVSLGERIVQAVTVPDFADVVSKRHMLALIIFSVLVGLGAASAGEEGRTFREFLRSGNAVMMKVVGYIMWYAPLGLGAYFAYLVGVFGPQLLTTYGQAVAIYYPVSLLYFGIAFTFYALFAGGVPAARRFWSHIPAVALTALATGSSMAAMPLNLKAAEDNGVPEDVRELVIPIGATIHMDGSCLSAILKIAVLFALFGIPLSGAGTLLGAVGVALLSGTVMSGIPGGGFLGEMLIVSLYGFPPEALPIAAMVGTLVDPPATMVNAVGDNVSSMMVARLAGTEGEKI